MKIFRHINSIREYLGGIRAKKKTVGFVPTMGALHEGHFSLARKSIKDNDITVVSIFVNPAQFGPNEDYKKYPRVERRDIRLCGAIGVDCLFIPAVEQMYPPEFNTFVEVKGLDENLCGPLRPGHFRGVATVVAKLFNIIRPDSAYFGKKDFQQYSIIKKMARDLNFNIKVVGLPTIRDVSGLALSSRNAYLSSEETEYAPLIFMALKKVEFMLKYKKLRSPKKAYEVFSECLKRIPNSKVEYFQIVDRLTLRVPAVLEGKLLAACAVRVGDTRLIDNIEVKTA